MYMDLQYGKETTRLSPQTSRAYQRMCEIENKAWRWKKERRGGRYLETETKVQYMRNAVLYYWNRAHEDQKEFVLRFKTKRFVLLYKAVALYNINSRFNIIKTIPSDGFFLCLFVPEIPADHNNIHCHETRFHIKRKFRFGRVCFIQCVEP